MVWGRLRHWFSRRGHAHKSNDLRVPEVKWLDLDDNPWGVPVLDVRPVTLNMLSTTGDPQCASNAASFEGDDGTGFIGVEPSESGTAAANLRYRVEKTLAEGILFTPREMEQKWALFYHGGQILCIRSWLRQVEAVAEVRHDGDYVEVTKIRGKFVTEDEEPQYTARVLDYLLRSHALELTYPAPLPVGREQDPKAAAIWCMSCFGNRALVATPHELVVEPPEEPLRTDSMLHIAVARGDVESAMALLNDGLPIDLLARDGLAPLHWALAREDTAMLSFLLERGSPIDVRSDEGATPLMNAIQDGNSEMTTFLLDHGADPDATDERGFTGLHRAAEMGHAELVRLLLDRGAAPNPEAQGQTPRSLAELRSETAIANLLDGATH